MPGNEWVATTRRIEDARRILAAESPMTIRQLFYRLVSAGLIENCQEHYKRVSRDMTKARKSGRVEWDWIVDRSRPTYAATAWDDLADYGRSIKHGYRKDYWCSQREYVELWSEKDSVTGSILDVTLDLGITLRAARGFTSTSRVREVAEHLMSIRKPTTIFYIGDHDPSGENMPIEVAERVKEQLRALICSGGLLPSERARRLQKHRLANNGDFFSLHKLAIHKSDIAEYGLPPLRIKRDEEGNFTDSRAKAFLAKYGDECVELDALPPQVLRERVEEAVTAHIDKALWDRALMVEKAEVASIETVVNAWSKQS